MNSRYTAETLAKKLKKLPSRELASWIEKHPGKVLDIDYEGGFTTESGLAYDLLLAPGFVTGDGEFMHTIIEPRARTVLALLRGVKSCECEQCLVELAADAKAVAA